jgi:hypothetical protein
MLITVSSLPVLLKLVYCGVIPVIWGEPLAFETYGSILALVPPSLDFVLTLLEKTTPLPLSICSNVEAFVLTTRDKKYAVVLLPADGIIPHEWCSLWGAISCLDPRPSILVYSHTNDSRIWAGVLAAGGFDVITPPFTEEKISYAMRSAADDFRRKLALWEANALERPT